MGVPIVMRRNSLKYLSCGTHLQLSPYEKTTWLTAVLVLSRREKRTANPEMRDSQQDMAH
jgi:hypothetical protein